MRTKHGFRFFTLLAVLTMVFGMAATGFAATTLTFDSTATPNSLRGIAEQMWMDEVALLSKGELQFETTWGGAIAGQTESLRAVADGVVDLAEQNPNFYPRQLLYHNAISVPQQLPINYMLRMERYYDRILAEVPEMTEEFTRYNQRILYNYNVSHYVFDSIKPVHKLADLKGMKARASVRWQLNLLKDIGAIPITMPMTEVPMALQTNVLEGSLFSVDATDMNGIPDVAPYILLIPELATSTPYYICINLDKFNSLPKNLQDTLVAAEKSARAKFAQRYDEIRAGILDKWSKNSRVHVTLAKPDDFINPLNALPSMKTNPDDWVREAENDGAKNARVIMDKVLQFAAESLAEEAALNAKK